MSKRKSKKYVSQRERVELLEKFLEDLDEDDIFENLDSDSDTDTDMDELDTTGEGDLNETFDLDNDVDNVNNDDSDTNNVNSNTSEAENENINFINMEDVAELPRKAKFRSLDEITNEENFYGLKQVENKQYNFSTANKQL